jgi:exopolysaccharide production protein ExoY
MKDDHSVFRLIDAVVVADTVRVPATAYMIWGKRLFDIAFASVALILLSPLIAVIWCIVSLDGGTGFYGQERVGKGRRLFTCWKLRSMVVDADERLLAHLASDGTADAEWHSNRKLSNDPRVTALGHFIRKTSIDELPQLWNVLIGDMSIVGPRPVVGDELRMYGAAKASYLALRPGITGLWQVNGRNAVSYDARVAFDKEYCRTITFFGDLRLILKTVMVVINRTGC